MVSTFPLRPSAAGDAESVVTAGQSSAHSPLQTLFPEPAGSLSKTYTVRPCPSTTTVPRLVSDVARTAPDAAEEPAEDEPPDEFPYPFPEPQPASPSTPTATAAAQIVVLMIPPPPGTGT